jgi:hypothetical protein
MHVPGKPCIEMGECWDKRVDEGERKKTSYLFAISLNYF